MPVLDWIGKKAVADHHKQVPFHLLKCNKDLSIGDPGSGNILVQGDNLIALKALIPYYARQVKFIYIDPPYNTGNESWITAQEKSDYAMKHTSDTTASSSTSPYSGKSSIKTYA